MKKLFTGHEDEMAYQEAMDKREVESAAYSISQAEKEIARMESDMGIDEIRGDLSKIQYNDAYRFKKIEEKSAYVAELKAHYKI